MARGNYRLDTPKGKVQYAFDQTGEQSARVLAKELGVESKIERWVRAWTEKRIPTKGSGTGRRRVYLKGDPAKGLGTVIEAGDEQSIVQWDEGYRACEINTWLVSAKVETTR